MLTAGKNEHAICHSNGTKLMDFGEVCTLVGPVAAATGPLTAALQSRRMGKNGRRGDIYTIDNQCFKTFLRKMRFSCLTIAFE